MKYHKLRYNNNNINIIARNKANNSNNINNNIINILLTFEVQKKNRKETYIVNPKITQHMNNNELLRFFREYADQIVVEYTNGRMAIWPNPEE